MREAAIYLLKYNGQRGTEKQIEKLLKTAGPSVVRMAMDRGYKPTLKLVGAV